MKVRLLCALAVLLVMIALPLSASAQDQETAEQADAQARAYFKVGSFEDAAKEFARAFDLDPKPTRLYNAALAYEKGGLPAKAIDMYARYLERDNQGDKAIEARARKKALEEQIQNAAKQAQLEKDEKVRLAQIETFSKQASTHLAVGEYDAAAKVFEKAYQASHDPEYLFEKAEALRLAGKLVQALAGYRLYRRTAPDGINAASAERQQTALEKATSPARAKALPIVTDSVHAQSEEPTIVAKQPRGISWGWVTLGTAFIAGAAAADLIPASGSNGEFDPSDLVPVALYGVGGLFVFKGVF